MEEKMLPIICKTKSERPTYYFFLVTGDEKILHDPIAMKKGTIYYESLLYRGVGGSR